MQMRGLDGKTAVVVGGAQGIGRAVALELARYGARVAVLDAKEPTDTLEELKSGGAKAFGMRADVRNIDSMRTAAAEVTSALGTPTLLVNSVGVRSFGPILEVSTEIWNNTLAVIMTGAFNTARAFCPAMVEKAEGSV